MINRPDSPEPSTITRERQCTMLVSTDATYRVPLGLGSYVQLVDRAPHFLVLRRHLHPVKAMPPSPFDEYSAARAIQAVDERASSMLACHLAIGDGRSARLPEAPMQ